MLPGLRERFDEELECDLREYRDRLRQMGVPSWRIRVEMQRQRAWSRIGWHRIQILECVCTFAAQHTANVRLWAAGRALDSGAYARAKIHLFKALDALHSLADSPRRRHQESMADAALCRAIVVTGSFTASEVQQIYEHALSVCASGHDAGELFNALGVLWRTEYLQTHLEAARTYGQMQLVIARRKRNPTFFLAAHQGLGIVDSYVPHHRRSLAHLQRALAYGRAVRFQSDDYRHTFTAHPSVSGLSCIAWPLFLLGHPDQALQSTLAAVDFARTHQNGDRFNLAYALGYHGMISQLRQDAERVAHVSDELLQLVDGQTDDAFQMWRALATMLHGWVVSLQGQALDGAAEIQRGLELWPTQLGRPFWGAMLADAYRAAGLTQKALRVVTDTLMTAQSTGQRFFDSELWRLQGELLQNGAAHDDEIHACFRQAVNLARRQKAKILELRAVLSYGRFLAERGQAADTSCNLATLRSSFTEGYDCADLRRADIRLREQLS